VAKGQGIGNGFIAGGWPKKGEDGPYYTGRGITGDADVRIAYFSSGRFGAILLSNLLKKGIRPSIVFTLPDRPQGRGLKLHPVPVKALAEKEGLAIKYVPLCEQDDDLLKDYELILSCDISFIFPPWMVRSYACYNLHPSLLPRWRGPAPIFWTIKSGDVETGVTLFRMEEAIDSGMIVLQERVKVESDWNYAQLESVLLDEGAKLIEQFLSLYPRVELTPQDGETTYARKFEKKDLKINWESPCQLVYNLIKASAPYWGSWTNVGGKRLKIFAGEVILDSDLLPGQVVIKDGDVIVGCGRGAVKLLEVQLEGKRKMSIREFLSGYKGFLIKAGRME